MENKKPDALEVEQHIFDEIYALYEHEQDTDKRNVYINVLSYLAFDFWRWYNGRSENS